MEMPHGHASYKKNAGILTLTEDLLSLIWTPLPGNGPPTVSLAVGNITNLQQTPDTAAKVILKVVEKARQEGAEGTSYMFQFASDVDGRAEANAVKDVLSNLIKNMKSDPGLLWATNGDRAALLKADGASKESQDAGPTKPVVMKWFDDDALKDDVELQESLMGKDSGLQRMYWDARECKPASIADVSFNRQFWSTRISLLRAHAFEQNQRKGAYNVLALIKPKTVEGELKLDLNLDYIRMILQQFPLIRRLYNENVPKIDEGDFWSRFFLSRLSKRLKGERVNGNDNSDPLFDTYTEADNTAGPTRLMAQQVRRTIDVEGNEENQGGFRTGNRKDVEMRPRKDMAIVRTLNSLSESILGNVAPTDQDSAGREAQDDAILAELALRDLRGDAELQRVMLNVKEQDKLLVNSTTTTPQQDRDAVVLAAQNPADVLFEVAADLDLLEDDGAGGIDLHRGIGVDDEHSASDDSDEEAAKKSPHVGSRAARRAAQSQLLDAMRKKRLEDYGQSASAANRSPMGIDADLAQKCCLTNATTTEFLRQFWACVLGGGNATTARLSHHAEALRKCADRIAALSNEAERARTAKIDKLKTEAREEFRRTGKKTKMPGGGKEAVAALFESTTASLRRALDIYKREAQTQGR